ncbi:GerA spore germination protein [Paenibacillus sp. cl141a]|nr:GerA spore germination protein [Paenibacillus sp. cl141a]
METSAENVVRGTRESFSEALRTNTALIRRKIKDPNLWMETKQIGRVTQTDVAMMYIKMDSGNGCLKKIKSPRNPLERLEDKVVCLIIHCKRD